MNTPVSADTPAINLESRVKTTLGTFLGFQPEEIKNTDNLAYDLGADSLDAIEVVMAIEEEFNIEISDEDAEKLETVQQIIDYLRHKGVKAD